MERIDGIRAKEVRDSRGNPTIEVAVRSGTHEARAKVPSGKSAGSREAFELRDPDGKGVSRAIKHVEDIIAPALLDLPVDPGVVDAKLLFLDGTPNKSNLGANAILGVSMATTRLAAMIEHVPLWKYVALHLGNEASMPRLFMNMLNGGVHASFCLPFQEYIVVVGEASAADSYEKAKKIFTTLGTLIERECGSVPRGDEGGYAPEFSGIEKPFEMLCEAIKGDAKASLAIDAAASEFFHGGIYTVLDRPYTSDTLLEVYKRLAREYGVKSIEDPFDEDDLAAYERITKEEGKNLLIVGDDLTVTNPRIVQEMVARKRANAFIVKPNQIGTISEVLEAVQIAKQAGWKLIASHRSGETDDTFIADLAVGIGAYGLKAGAPSQRERRVKYERLIEIDKEMTGD